jgi:hypothetical protein
MKNKLIVILSLLVMTLGSFGLTSTSAASMKEGVIVQPKVIEGPGGGSECISLINTLWITGEEATWAGSTVSGVAGFLKKKIYGLILASWVAERILSLPDVENNQYKIDTYLNGCDGTYIKRLTAYDEDWSYLGSWEQEQ